jgi:hypothetical protein
MMRRGRPGLLGVAARTAVVAGTATAVVGGVSRHQQSKANQAAEAQAYEDQQNAAAMQAAAQQAAAQQQAAAPAPAGGASETIAQLQQLAQLKEQGILTEAEFAAEKAKILGL